MLAVVEEKLQARERDISAAELSVVVSGASGLVGSAFCDRAEATGWHLRRMVRQTSTSPRDIQWSPATGVRNAEQFLGVDAVVHLAGENIAKGRWTSAKKDRIRDSRARGTRLLCETLAALPKPPRVLVCASAIGFYGERGNELVDEAQPAGRGFLPEVCVQWERATQPAVDAGIRVVNLRIGVVLSTRGGALQQMLLPFRLGLGGRIGNGAQYWSWISLPDLVRAIEFSIENDAVVGAVNAVSPQALTNADFTKSLGKVLHRPTAFPVPAFMARLVLGEMADDLLLSSIRVAPSRLHEAGFEFQHPQLDGALRAVLESRS